MVKAWHHYLPFGLAGLLGLCTVAAGIIAYSGHPLPGPAPAEVPLPAPAPPHPAPTTPPAPAAASPAPMQAVQPKDAGEAQKGNLPKETPQKDPATLVTPGKVSPPLAANIRTVSALPPAPDPELITRGQYGFIPIMHGTERPWKVYARPFDTDDRRPRIALIINGLGLSASATDTAIRELDPNITLAFAPFARRLGQWMNLARATGHETLMELPMEPLDFPRQDPGYNALLTANEPAQNLDRLSWVMSQAVGYTGLIARMGGRLAASEEAMQPILKDIANRGLLFIDNHATAQSAVQHLAGDLSLSTATVTRTLDANQTEASLDRNLNESEAIARREGFIILSAPADKAILTHLISWTKGLEAKGFALAPVSAVIGETPAPGSQEEQPESAPAPEPAPTPHAESNKGHE